MNAAIAAASPAFDANYKRDITVIHCWKSSLVKRGNFTDADYRALLRQVSNGQVESSTHLAPDQRRDLLDRMRKLVAAQAPEALPQKKPGHRPHDSKPTSGKLLALWISAYHLGIVRDKTDKGLAAFVKRQMGVDDLRFHNSADAHKAIEALKDWMAREGLVIWDNKKSARVCVIYGQWKRLRSLGAFSRVPPEADESALSQYMWRAVGRVCSPEQLEDADADKAIVKLGSWIRSQVKKNAGL